MADGHRVVFAFDGAEFVSIMKQQMNQDPWHAAEAFDVVLVNLLLHRMDVPQTIR